MSGEAAASSKGFVAGLIAELQKSAAEPRRFWQSYLEQACRACDAQSGALYILQADDAPKGAGEWALAQVWPADAANIHRGNDGNLADLAADCARQGGNIATKPPTGSTCLLVSSVDTASAGRPILVVIRRNDDDLQQAEALSRQLPLFALVPELLEQQRRSEATRQESARLAGALDLMVTLNGENKFLAAAMRLCNELVTRFESDRVSLGWIEGNYIEVKAISHTEKFEKKMEAVQTLASTMEECVDQAQEIGYPKIEGATYVTRDHERFAKSQEVTAVASVPFFRPETSEGEVAPTESPACGVITFERNSKRYSEDELRSLRVIADQASRLLWDLRRSDGWIGSRMARSIREQSAKLLGVEHTWMKLLAVLLMIILAVLIFWKKEYRVEGTFEIQTDSMALFSAPFDGHLATVSARVGDEIVEGADLLTLDTRELFLQRQSVAADQARFEAELVRAQSTGDVSGMKMAQARVDQSAAELAIVEFRLSQSEIKAPFDGILVEGDLHERIAAPVRKGDPLMKLARIEGLYFEMQVPESEIQEMNEGSTGEAAFASQPGERFPFAVDRIQPIARSGEDGNVFAVRCRFTGEPADWWRPGMTGVAKADAGKRTLLWIYTHKTVDFLRMFFW